MAKSSPSPGTRPLRFGLEKFFFPPLPASLSEAEAVVELYEDEAQWNHIAQNALATMQDNFSFTAARQSDRHGPGWDFHLGTIQHQVWGLEQRAA